MMWEPRSPRAPLPAMAFWKRQAMRALVEGVALGVVAGDVQQLPQLAGLDQVAQEARARGRTSRRRGRR